MVTAGITVHECSCSHWLLDCENCISYWDSPPASEMCVSSIVQQWHICIRTNPGHHN